MLHKTFTFESFHWDNTTLILNYSSDELNFSEVWDFPNGKNYDYRTLNQVSQLLHLLAGISYYKAFLPKEIKINYPISKELSEFLNKTYTNGLGEFAYQNKVTLDVNFPYSESKIHRVEYKAGTVVPLGGGKDSLTTAAILEDQSFRLISVNKNKIFDNLANRLGRELINPVRKIDPKLIEINKQGALNGHVPISAILASSFLIAGIIYDFDTVVMSNENSSNFGNTFYQGKEINHQYSKSFEFEADFRKIVFSEISENFNYFSLLRPLSELDITRIFSREKNLLDSFTSCNKSFKLFSESNRLWCCDCPKCRFVFLALSNFMHFSQVTEIFGKNLLDDETQILGYEELLGEKNIKPFECVGEIEECRTLMLNLQDKFPDLVVVKHFSHLTGEKKTTLEFSQHHFLNEKYLKLVYEAYRS